MTKSFLARAAAVTFAGAAFASQALAADISGAGATFPYPIYAKWADTYKKETGIGLNYQSIGSGGGIKQIKAKTVTFGASDMPLECEGARRRRGLVQLPMVMGGIVPVVNLDGIKPGELVLDGPTLAKIFLGEIKTWDDAAIKKLNPGAQAAVGSDRRRASLGRLGHDLQLHRLSLQGQPRLEVQGRRQHRRRMAGRHRRQGQRGRRQQRQQTKGSIGYVEYAYAKQNKLTTRKMINKDGKTVAADRRAFQAAAANADWAKADGYGVILTDQPGAEVWPIAGATFILMPQAAEGCGRGGGSAQVLRLGLQEGRRHGGRTSTTCRCRSNVMQLDQKNVGRRSRTPDGKPVFTSTELHLQKAPARRRFA